MKAAFLFPGQGAQQVNMLHELPDDSNTRDTLTEAAEALAADPLSLDSKDRLRSTSATQLALLICGVAHARALIGRGIQPEAVAGLSVGAYGAAVAADVLSVKDALQLVRLRGEAMEAQYTSSYGLAAVSGLDEKTVQRLVAAIHSDRTPVFVGNINGPRQIVVVGSNAGLDRLIANARSTGASKAERLNVTTLSHCPLLQPVADQLRGRIKGIARSEPRCPYVSNVHGRALRSADAILEDLADNIAHGVRWFDATSILEELGCNLFLEMPPGRVLTDLATTNQPTVRSLAVSQYPMSKLVQIVKW
jgi:malonate decarboxylase epsilon subunit